MILQGLCEHEMDVAIMKKQEEEKVALLRMTANVQVAVRVRPLNKREKDLRISQGVREEDWLKVILQRSFDLPGAVAASIFNSSEVLTFSFSKYAPFSRIVSLLISAMCHFVGYTLVILCGSPHFRFGCLF